MSEHLQHALAYAEHGWQVLPLRPNTKDPYKDIGVYQATTDQAQIFEWWTRWPDANIGCHCGASGLVAIDEDAIDVLINGGIELDTNTVTNLTARGEHLVYRQPPDIRIGNRHRNLPDDVHVRGYGGYIVLPPSVHPDGPRYEWEDGYSPFDIVPAPLPDDLLRLLLSDDMVDASIIFDDVDAPSVPDLRLPQAAKDAIFNPAPKGKRSEQDASVIWHLLHTARLTPSEVKAIYDTHPIGSRGKYSERGLQYLERTIRSAYSFQPAHTQATDEQTAARRVIHEARYSVIHYPWSGRRGSNARALMLAILEHMDTLGMTETHLSRRHMADLSGIGRETCSRIIKAGMLDPFIERTAESDGRMAEVWRLVAQSDGYAKQTSSEPEPQGDGYAKGTKGNSPEVEQITGENEPHFYTLLDVSMCGSKSPVFPETLQQTAKVFESDTYEIARQLSSLLADDAFVRNFVPESKRQDVTHIYAKSFTHVGRDVLGYCAARDGKALLSDVIAFTGKGRQAVVAAVHRMSDALSVLGVAPLAQLVPDPCDKRRRLIVLHSDWRARLDEARPHLYTYGLIERRREIHAAERWKRFMRIADMTKNEEVRAHALKVAEGANKVFERSTGRRLGER